MHLNTVLMYQYKPHSLFEGVMEEPDYTHLFDIKWRLILMIYVHIVKKVKLKVVFKEKAKIRRVIPTRTCKVAVAIFWRSLRA